MPQTWRAGESIAVKARPALTGERSLRVVAHSILMASALLALVNVYSRGGENRKRTSTEIEFLPQARMSPACQGLLLWSQI